jgi:hypothetical protein
LISGKQARYYDLTPLGLTLGEDQIAQVDENTEEKN